MLSRPETVSFTARLPHPFHFDRFRQLEGTQGDISREETAVHLHARWTVPVGEAVEIALFGGPTFFRASQELLTEVDFSQEYPYDTATLGRATTREYDGSTVGFNVGADIAAYFSKWVGVGGLIRFSRADLDLSDGSTTVTVGGLHTAGGLAAAVLDPSCRPRGPSRLPRGPPGGALVRGNKCSSRPWPS